MDELQTKIRDMVLELIEAMRRAPNIPGCRPYNPSEIVEITNALPGIEDATFFDRPFDEQDGLGWIRVAFFGRGERAIPLFLSGVLRDDFDTEYRTLLRRYQSLHSPLPPSPPSIESERASRKLLESLEKAERIKKANKP